MLNRIPRARARVHISDMSNDIENQILRLDDRGTVLLS